MERDFKETIRWFEKSAELGNVKAQYNLGRCYYLGHGVKQDSGEAEKWFRIAAKHGNKTALVCFKNK